MDEYVPTDWIIHTDLTFALHWHYPAWGLFNKFMEKCSKTISMIFTVYLQNIDFDAFFFEFIDFDAYFWDFIEQTSYCKMSWFTAYRYWHAFILLIFLASGYMHVFTPSPSQTHFLLWMLIQPERWKFTLWFCNWTSHEKYS